MRIADLDLFGQNNSFSTTNETLLLRIKTLTLQETAQLQVETTLLQIDT